MIAINGKLAEQINLKLSPSERAKQYIELVGDPYTINNNGKKIKIKFNGNKPFNLVFQKYFLERRIPK